MKIARFTSSPDAIRVKGGYADCNHPTARAFSIINDCCVLTAQTHPPIFHALQHCVGKPPSDIAASLHDYGVSAHPDLPTKANLQWFEQNWTGDLGALHERTCSGRVWRNISTEAGTVSVVSFWPESAELPTACLQLILERLGLPEELPVYVEFMDSTEPLSVSASSVARRFP